MLCVLLDAVLVPSGCLLDASSELSGTNRVPKAQQGLSEISSARFSDRGFDSESILKSLFGLSRCGHTLI